MNPLTDQGSHVEPCLTSDEESDEEAILREAESKSGDTVSLALKSGDGTSLELRPDDKASFA